MTRSLLEEAQDRFARFPCGKKSQAVALLLCILVLAELHGDLFSRHASPLEGYAFVAVDERGEDCIPDEVCRRNNSQQERRRRGGRSVRLPDWVMNKIKRKHIIVATMKSVVTGHAPITLEWKII